MENNKKRRIMLAVMLVAIISVGVVGTYAYFLTSAGRNEEQKLTIKTGTLSLVFEDNDEGLTDQIMLGESRSKEFKIRNTGTEQVTTNMLWSGLVNTYLEESLSYTLEYKTAEDGTWQTVSTVSHTNIPQSERTSDYNLATDLTIPSGATYYYKLTITFNNLEDVNQEADKTAILSTKFKLGDEIPESPSLNTVKKLNLSVKDGNPTFADAATTDETKDGLYSLEDDYGTSYYYRGAVENNYIKFGGFYWRIIRINGDGSIRMIYDGTQAWPNANGAIGSTDGDRYTHIEQAWNTSYNDDAKYVGYMYGGKNGVASTKQDIDGTESTEEEKSKAATYNQTNSNVKSQIDAWYRTNITNKNLSKYISDEIFCNDRTTPGKSETDWTYDTGLGYGGKYTAYGAMVRLGSYYGIKIVSPKFKCSQKNDAFTVSDIEKGNGNLTYPVGLITADEVIAARGGNYNNENRHYYLYKNLIWYWSLSPYFMNSDNRAYVLSIAKNAGGLHSSGVKEAGAIAPVINIAPEYAATLTGSGTMESPYQIPGVE